MLTVVIPVYNEEEILKEQLEIILKDLYSLQIKHEIRVVENGSTDSTWAILESLEKKHPDRIVAEQIPDANLGRARQKGINTAQGNFIYISDLDYWLPEFIEEAWKKRHKSEIILGTKEKDNRNLIRRGMKFGKNRLFKLFFNVQFTDITQIILVKRALAQKTISKCSSSHAIMILEFLIRLQWAGHTFTEIPVEQKSELRPPRLAYHEKIYYAAREFLSLLYNIYSPF